MTWVYLIAAILSEVAATLSLRVASQGGTNQRWFTGVVVGYLAAFALLAATLREGLTVGVAYGIWAASGVALVAVASRILFKEPLTRIMGLGIVLVAIGVLLIELGASH